MSSYKLSEIVDTYQAEGLMSGWPVRLFRFSGCNFSCPFCDEYLSGPKHILGVEELAAKLPKDSMAVMLTGGEPLLQLDAELAKCLLRWVTGNSRRNIFIETNGSVCNRIDLISKCSHIVCSPKPEKSVTLPGHTINELKYVVPGTWGFDSLLENLTSFGKSFHLQEKVCIQPEWRDNGIKTSLQMALRCSQYIQKALGFMPRLSIQWHKFVNLP